jgi:hypothetical protein
MEDQFPNIHNDFLDWITFSGPVIKTRRTRVAASAGLPGLHAREPDTIHKMRPSRQRRELFGVRVVRMLRLACIYEIDLIHSE